MKNEKEEKETVQKHVMVMGLANAYDEYKRQYPTRKIGFTTFKKMKPAQVRLCQLILYMYDVFQEHIWYSPAYL